MPQGDRADAGWSRALYQSRHAIASCQQALNIDPEHIGARNNLGFAPRAIGRIEQAIDLFKKTIAASPRTAARLYYNLASSKRIAASDPDFAAMKRLAKDVGAFELEDQIGLHFALGKAYADVGDHARAFKELAKGNTLKRRQFMGYDEAKVSRRFERISEAFSAGLLRQKAGAGNRSPVPVFIVGMPRSGTSLVEQILASHPKVFGAGERYELGDLADAIEGKNGAEFPEAVAGMSSAELNALGTNYVTAMRALAPDAARIIDKMPGNFFNAGLLHLALPNARIIHTRRDPRNTALSCFSILFALGHAYTYDLGELGRYIAAYQRLMEHWRQVLPDGAMLEVQYEELVGDLETEARRIVEFCGLGWDAACLSFYKTERPVRTASVIQVRQPIYPSSVGRWAGGIAAFADRLGAGLKTSLHQAGYNIHGQREHGDIEEERDDAVHGRQSADRFAGDLNVGDLRRHRDHERVIEEVPIVRILVAGENKSADLFVATRAIEFVRIVQRENPMHESP